MYLFVLRPASTCQKLQPAVTRTDHLFLLHERCTSCNKLYPRFVSADHYVISVQPVFQRQIANHAATLQRILYPESAYSLHLGGSSVIARVYTKTFPVICVHIHAANDSNLYSTKSLVNIPKTTSSHIAWSSSATSDGITLPARGSVGFMSSFVGGRYSDLFRQGAWEGLPNAEDKSVLDIIFNTHGMHSDVYIATVPIPVKDIQSFLDSLDAAIKITKDAESRYWQAEASNKECQIDLGDCTLVLDELADVLYRYPPSQDVYIASLFEQFKVVGVVTSWKDVFFLYVPEKDAYYVIPWGYVDFLVHCKRRYVYPNPAAPIQIAFGQPRKIYPEKAKNKYWFGDIIYLVVFGV